jgi:hypothetical protein
MIRWVQPRRLVGRLVVGSSPQKVSYQAFLKLRVRWTPELRSRLMSACCSRMPGHFGVVRFLWRAAHRAAIFWRARSPPPAELQPNGS